MSEAEQVVQSEATPAATVSIETPAEIAQGGSGNDFLSSIPEDLREHPSLSPIKDVGNLARSYVNAQRLIGADKIPMPVNPTDDDLDNIYSKLGRPETPSQYNIAADGNVLTEERATEYSEIAHKLRLNPDQAQGVLDYYMTLTHLTMQTLKQWKAQQRHCNQSGVISLRLKCKRRKKLSTSLVRQTSWNFNWLTAQS